MQAIDDLIIDAIGRFDKSSFLSGKEDRPFEELISMGELIDRLCIINWKLYLLKDEVAKRQSDAEFCAWQAIEDIRLVKERARLKKCIDLKLISMIHNVASGDPSAGFNAEVKKYGDKI